MGRWGRWLGLDADDVDLRYVLWATSRLVSLDGLPTSGLLVRFERADRPGEHVWMLLREPTLEICTTYPGGAEDLVVKTDAETLTRWHLRHLSYGEAVATGRLRIEGADRARELFVDAIRPSPFAVAT